MMQDNEFDDRDPDGAEAVEDESFNLDTEQLRVFSAEDEDDVDLDLETAEANPTKPDLAGVLADLARGERLYVGLHGFSDLTSTELELLKDRWFLIDAGLRASVIREALDISLENFQFAFTRLFVFATTDDEPDVRQLAVTALGYEQTADAAERLLELVRNDPSDDVRTEAAKSLGPYVTLAEWEEFTPELASRLSQTLLGIAEDEDESWHIRRRAAESVSACGPSVRINRLVQRLYDEDEIGLRASALYVAGRGNQRAWLAVAIEEFANDDAEIRREAARSAGMFGDADALPGLSEIARTDEDTEVRHTAIVAIGEIGGAGAIRILSRLEESALEHDAEVIDGALIEASLWSDPFSTGFSAN